MCGVFLQVFWFPPTVQNCALGWSENLNWQLGRSTPITSTRDERFPLPPLNRLQTLSLFWFPPSASVACFFTSCAQGPASVGLCVCVRAGVCVCEKRIELSPGYSCNVSLWAEIAAVCSIVVINWCVVVKMLFYSPGDRKEKSVREASSFPTFSFYAWNLFWFSSVSRFSLTSAVFWIKISHHFRGDRLTP